MTVVVRERRVVLLVCLLLAAVFVPLSVLSLRAAAVQRTAAAYLLFAMYLTLAVTGLALALGCAARQLVLAEEGCRYTTWYGRTRTFAMADIRQLQTMVVGGCASFALIGHWGGRLARVEMHMAGALQAYIWLCEHGVEVDGLPHWVSGSTYDEWDVCAWHPDLPWRIRHRGTVRRMNLLLGWVMLALGVAALLFMPLRLRSFVLLLGPASLCLPFLAFPKTILSDNPPHWDEEDGAHFIREYGFSLLLPRFLLPVLCVMDIGRIRLTSWRQCILPCLLILAAIFATYVLFVLPHSRSKREVPVMLVAIFLFVVGATHHLNFLLTIQPPTHTEMRVVGYFTKKLSVRRNRIRFYYLKLQAGYRGEIKTVRVSSRVCSMGVRDGSVQFCECESLLGVRYWQVHRVDERGIHE